MKAFARSRFNACGSALLCVGFTLTLTGCGGGGGGSTDNNAKPLDAGGFEVPVDASTTPSHFKLIDSRPGGSGSSSQTPAVLDTDSRKIVKVLDGYQTGWFVSDRYVVNAASGAAQRAGLGYAYLIKDGKVMQLDLSGSTLGEPKQISSMTNACAMAGGAGWDLAPDGKHQLVRIITAGEGATCDNLSSYQQYYISSDMATTASPVLAYGKYNSTGVSVEGVLTDAQGLSIGVLAMNMGTHRLYVVSNDLQRELYSVKDNFTSGSEQIQMLQVIPGTQKGVLMAGNRLYVADWQSGKLVLSGQATTLAMAMPWEAQLIKNKGMAYVVDKASVYAVSGATGQVTKLADSSVAAGSSTSVSTELYDTTDFVVIQRTIYSSTNTTSTWTSVNKASGQVKSLDDLSNGSVSILGSSGNGLLMSRYSVNGLTSVELYNLTILSTQKLHETANAVTPLVQYVSDGWRGKTASNVIWYESTGASASSAVALDNYDLSTGQTTSIGTLPEQTQGAGTGYYSSFDTNWADEASVLVRNGVLWQFSANQPAYLVEVPVPN